MRRSDPPAPAAPPRHDPPLKIGLSARIMHDPPAELGFRNKKVLQYLEQSIAHWIMGQGALVFMVPTIEAGSRLQRERVTMRDYVRELDAEEGLEDISACARTSGNDARWMREIYAKSHSLPDLVWRQAERWRGEGK